MIKVNDFIVNQNHFPDGTLHIDLPTLSDNWVKIKWNYENDAELFTLVCIRRHYEEYPAILIMPYIPHARMDRVKEKNDVFTLKYFCEVINDLKFNKVIVTDPHSNVASALINRVVIDDASENISAAIISFESDHEDNAALFFPDEGAMKRYADNYTEFPFAFGMKKRDWTTGKILGLNIMQKENIVGKDVLIIDDICSRGGTFYYSAKALLEAGAKSVSLYVTHCENTILEGKIFTSGMIEKVYTTPSLVHKDELKNKIIYV